MIAVFLKIFNLSILATWLVLAVVLLRIVLKKVPKAFICMMWGIVALRLIFPFSIESIFSLIPSNEPIPEDIIYLPEPEIDIGIPVINQIVNPVIKENFAPEIGDSVNPLQIVSYAATWVWLIGIFIMIVYAVISYLRIYRRVRVALLVKENIYYCDNIQSPFILGVIRPKIYLPSSMSSENMKYVIAHEKAHLKRLDHFWKPFGYFILTVYWFNPALWVGYILLCRDIETACDEKVISKMGVECKKGYSEALLSCSVGRKMIAVCPLAFGETGVKKRIKKVLNYKKPAFWMIVLIIIVIVALVVGFLTSPDIEDHDPVTDTPTAVPEVTVILDTDSVTENRKLMEAIGDAIEQYYKRETRYYGVYSARVLGSQDFGDTITIYLSVIHSYYGFQGNQIKMKNVLNEYDSTAITLDKKGNGYYVTEYWTPSTSDWTEEVRNRFPVVLHDVAINMSAMYDEQRAECELAAQAFVENNSYRDLLKYEINGYDSLTPDELKIKYTDNPKSFKKVSNIYLCGIESIYYVDFDITGNLKLLKSFCDMPVTDISECDCGIKTILGKIYRNEQYTIYERIIYGCETNCDWYWHSQKTEEGQAVFVVANGSSYYDAMKSVEAEKEGAHKFMDFDVDIANAGYTDISLLPENTSLNVQYIHDIKYPVYLFESYGKLVEFMNSDYKNYYKFNESLEMDCESNMGGYKIYPQNAPALADIDAKRFENKDLIMIYVPIVNNASCVPTYVHYNENYKGIKTISISITEFFDDQLQKEKQGLFLTMFVDDDFVDENTRFIIHY